MLTLSVKDLPALFQRFFKPERIWNTLDMGKKNNFTREYSTSTDMFHPENPKRLENLSSVLGKLKGRA